MGVGGLALPLAGSEARLHLSVGRERDLVLCVGLADGLALKCKIDGGDEGGRVWHFPHGCHSLAEKGWGVAAAAWTIELKIYIKLGAFHCLVMMMMHASRMEWQ